MIHVTAHVLNKDKEHDVHKCRSRYIPKLDNDSETVVDPADNPLAVYFGWTEVNQHKHIVLNGNQR